MSDERIWTPHDITVLLHHYAIASPWPHGGTEAYRDSMNKLFRLGLIDSENHLANATPKGEALIRMWCSQPPPVERFIDPRFQEGAL